MDIDQLRLQIKKQRASLTVDQIKQSSLLIAQQLESSNHFLQAKRIAYYLPVRGEADPTSLFERWNNKKEFYLPVLKQGMEIGLRFARVTKKTSYKANKFGIQEPIFNTDDLIVAEKLDLVITPLVSFDSQGNRVGMGGGFYDRTFAFKQVIGKEKPLLIGYAYGFQQFKKLTANSWDVPLDGIVTEAEMIENY